MKKALLGIATITALSIALTTGAYAHGHHGSHSSRSSSYSRSRYDICTVRDCTVRGNHRHSGRTYAPHHAGDGHRYH